MQNRRALIAAASSFLFSCTVPVIAAPKANDASAAVEAALKQHFPDVRIVGVRPAVVPGLYEVYTGEQIVYADAKGDYLVTGPVIDARTKRDLTAEQLDLFNPVEFDKLPLEQAIKTVRGNGRRVLVMFSDPDCPFCKQLETQMAAVTDVTIYTFLYPLADLHPEAPKRAAAIWCSPDRAKAWSDWMLERKLPEDRKCDVSAIESNLKLGVDLKVGSTPTMFTGKGRRITGAQPVEDILRVLDSNAPAPAQPAAAR